MAEIPPAKASEESPASFHVSDEALKRRVELIVGSALKSAADRIVFAVDRLFAANASEAERIASAADRLFDANAKSFTFSPSRPVVERAIEVIGDRDEALRWLGTPVRALDYATPISLLGQPDGEARVMNVLTQLEHGVL